MSTRDYLKQNGKKPLYNSEGESTECISHSELPRMFNFHKFSSSSLVTIDRLKESQQASYLTNMARSDAEEDIKLAEKSKMLSGYVALLGAIVSGTKKHSASL